MTAPTADELFGPPLDGASPQRLFKKHKVLPHPKRESYSGLRGAWVPAPGRKYDLFIDTALAGDVGSQPSSPQHPLRHRPRRIGSGPDLPPTPPAHSRTSSSGKSVPPSSPTYVQTPEQSSESVRPRPPSTPKNQMSPPTPDVTPPQAGSTDRRPAAAAARPVISERMPSKATTVDSRTESFKTARENPTDDEEDEEDGKSTLRPVLPSARTSQSTVRQAAVDGKKDARAVGLGLGLESSPGNLTPRSKREFIAFDGEWGSGGSEVEQEWDDNLDRNVTVKRRRAPARVNGVRKAEVVEDVTISPTNATKALRSMALPERILTFPSPKQSVERPKPFAADEPPASESSASTDVRRFSGMSSKSTVSTVVEAILVDTPPRRQKTLRHVKKQITLRDSGSEISPPSSAPTSLVQGDAGQRRKPNGVAHGARQGSIASTGTVTSISSGKARREVWKNGGIPVVIVPDRRSSTKSSREPSLRSTSSRRSKRSQSLSSVPLSQISKSKDLTPYFERPPRRGRAASESDGSTPGDQRTMDYPPIVPRRTSSLSAPTSRNASRSGSRSGSLTADSLKAHNKLQSQLQEPKQPPKPEPSSQQPKPPEVRLERAPPVETSKLPNGVDSGSEPTQSPRRLHSDQHGDAIFGKRLSVHNTPFSQVSVETNATSHISHAELSEAMAMNIYPHQNTSVLVVDHAHRLSSGSDETQKAKPAVEKDKPLPALPSEAKLAVKTTGPDAAEPLTPPQPQFSMDDVDSPLRNPRAPPEPPAIKFIPATPSGLTPAQEKQKMLGNYFEEARPKPSRSLSLVRQALGRRRHSEYGPSASRTGFLTRTLSLTRNMRRGAGDDVGPARDAPRPADSYPDPDGPPADAGRLHPFWRPASWYLGADDDLVRDVEDETYRYPLVDNRPPLPRRSLSSRMKRTFAILPLKPDEDDYPATDTEGPERRTVRRTPSGNLRVVKHRGSLDSLPQLRGDEARPYTAPETQRRRPFWQSHPLSRQGSLKETSDGKWGRILPTIGSKFEEYGIHTIPRRLSERRREKRTKELRQRISGPREVRDGVGDVIRRSSYRDAFTQARAA